MAEAIAAAAAVFLDPVRLGLMMLGILAGIFVGILPGLGGIVAVSIMLPFIYKLDAVAALATMTGAVAVVHTSDTITSVLLGAPGSAASTPSALEGHPLARKGQAARALSAAYLASLIGGIIGAVGLTLSIPIARPFVLAFGSPELFMLCALGVSFAGGLLGKVPLKGIAAGLFGLLLGTVGPTPAVAELRFTLGQMFLADGFNVVIVALGLFGIAEMISILSRGGGISHKIDLGSGWAEGVRDVVRHRWLVLRGSLVGMWVGVLPALGATAGAMMAYGQAVATARDKENFGKGDIRGLIAAEASNNSVMAGDLIPTLLFSVPGSATAALMVGALLRYGILPGPRFVTEHLDLMYVIVWSFAFSSAVGAGLCFLLSPSLARLTRVPFSYIAPPVLLTMLLGAYQVSNAMGEIWLLLLLGLFGWGMKQAGWPRAPLLIGYVLALPMERYFWLTLNLYEGYTWLLRPWVVAFGLVLVAPFVWGFVLRRRKREEQAIEHPRSPARWQAPSAVGVLFVILFAAAILEAGRYQPAARLLPWAVAIPGLLVAALQVAAESRGRSGGADDDEEGDEGAPPDPLEARRRPRRALMHLGGIVACAALISVMGFRAATALYMLVALLVAARMTPIKAALYTAITIGLLWFLGDSVLGLKWP